MNNQEYLRSIKSRFSNNATIRLDTQDQFVIYEEIFKWSWLATKLKITSCFKYSQSVQLTDIESYSKNCLIQAIKDKKGLPLGFQNGVVSYSVIASENISSDAIEFAIGRPKKHFAAFEMPVLINLVNSELYYYQGEILWGKLYDKFLKDYLLKHFCVA